MSDTIIDRRTVEDHKTLLTRLQQWAFGNGVKGASRRLDEAEKNIQTINTKLNILIIITAMNIMATIPDLLRMFRLI